MTEKEYMKLAIELARKGCGFVGPNPMVGAVIVKDGGIIGRGFHGYYGGPHAERDALADCSAAGTDPSGATMYVTLEPCCHFGKTPPCTEAIIESGISRVVIGASDPNPLVAGKGAETLRSRGIAVENGTLEKECVELNEVFFHFIQTRTPFVALKYAMTLDGKIASRSGESKWITGEPAREHAHGLRHKYSAIMAGIGTVLADDPMLNCRIEGGKNPIRVICDTNLRTPVTSKIAQTARDIKTFIACCTDDADRIDALEQTGCRIIRVGKKNGHIDLTALMKRLYEENIDSVLLEGGSEINFSAVASGIVNKAYVYVAPKIIGGETAKTPVGGFGTERLEDALFLSYAGMTVLGEDILLEYITPLPE